MLDKYGLVPHDHPTLKAGDRFGNLTVIQTAKKRTKSGKFDYFAIVQCDCGTTPSPVGIGRLRRGDRISCGCANRDKLTSHGLSRHPLYNLWGVMWQRCTDSNHRAYKHYGALGITVCDRWQSVENFFADMLDGYKPGLQIDRIDNSKGYSPENCRWVTRKTNMANRDVTVLVEFEGRQQTLTAWSDELGIKYGTLYRRIFIDRLPTKEAFTKKVRHSKRVHT